MMCLRNLNWIEKDLNFVKMFVLLQVFLIWIIFGFVVAEGQEITRVDPLGKTFTFLHAW